MPDLSHLELPDFAYMDLHVWPPLFQQRGVGVGVGVGRGPQSRDQLDNVYDQARMLIERNQYDRAIDVLDRVISGNGSQAPGAMYWKAYSLARIDRRPDALTTLGELRKQFPKSAWIKDAQALEVEVKQASGQSVSAEAQNDDELKLLALRGLQQSDPEAALPVIEKMLNGSSSVRVKDRALFLVSQSRSTRGRALILGVAKGNGNPDLQLRAIRYIGQMGGPEASQALDEVYRATSEERVKREIIRALGNASARERLLALAKGETSAELRGDAVRQLGNMNAGTELEQLYRSEHVGRGQAAHPAGDAERQQRRQAGGGGQERDRSATAALGDPLSGQRWGFRDHRHADVALRLGTVRRGEEGNHRGAVERRPRGCAGDDGAGREEPGAEAGDRPPARQHARSRGAGVLLELLN